MLIFTVLSKNGEPRESPEDKKRIVYNINVIIFCRLAAKGPVNFVFYLVGKLYD